jgi:hypothetical protein
VIFLLSRRALRPAQPPIQWVPGVKRQGREANHSRTVELHLHSPICLHGIVLSYIIKYRDNFTLYPLYRRLGGPQSPSGCCEIKMNLLQGIKPRFVGRSALGLVTVLEEIKKWGKENRRQKNVINRERKKIEIRVIQREKNKWKTAVLKGSFLRRRKKQVSQAGGLCVGEGGGDQCS